MDNRPISFSPPGRMVEADGSRFHLQLLPHRDSNRPWIVLETGLTLMSACWHWLVEELRPAANLLIYDRAGLGWSEERDTPRSGETAAQELQHLLQACSLSPPYILGGHSLGAIYNRAFHKLFPEQVRGFIWLDPSHPAQMQRHWEIRRRMKAFFFYLEASSLLAAKGLPMLNLPMVNQMRGLPDHQHRILTSFLRNSRHLRNSSREARAWSISSNFVQEPPPGDLPLLILSAGKNAMPGWEQLQRELARISRKAVHVQLDQVSHLSLLAHQQHVRDASTEIHRFLEEKIL